MTQHRIITIADVETARKAAMDDIARMDKNIADCVYDMDDCFVSHKLSQEQVIACDKQLDILKNGGVWTFKGYTDLDGNFLTPNTFRNKFGGWTTAYTNPETGKTIYSSANTTKGLLKKGIKVVDYEAPAWAKTTCGNIFGQFYSKIYEARYNRCTGEAQPRKVIGEHVDAA